MQGARLRLTWALLVQQGKVFLPGWFLWSLVLYRCEGMSPLFWQGVCLGGYLLLIALIDWRYGYIFDRMLLAMALTGVVGAAFRPVAIAPGEVLMSSLLGGGLLLLLRLLSQGGMGDGDIKFMVALGVWFSWQEVLLTLLAAFCAGGAAAAYLLQSRRRALGDSIPFAPFLAGGAALTLLYGRMLIDWYRSLL